MVVKGSDGKALVLPLKVKIGFKKGTTGRGETGGEGWRLRGVSDPGYGKSPKRLAGD